MLRQVVASLTIEQINQDREAFVNALQNQRLCLVLPLVLPLVLFLVLLFFKKKMLAQQGVVAGFKFWLVVVFLEKKLVTSCGVGFFLVGGEFVFRFLGMIGL